MRELVPSLKEKCELKIKMFQANVPRHAGMCFDIIIFIEFVFQTLLPHLPALSYEHKQDYTKNDS